MNDTSRALSALNHLDSYCCREEWIRIGIAAKVAGLDFEDFHAWSKSAPNYKGEKDCYSAWKSFKTIGGITEKTLFYMARCEGWIDPYQSQHNTKCDDGDINRQPDETNSHALSIWGKCLPATSSHEYISRKQGEVDEVRIYPDSAPLLEIDKTSVAGYLAVPCFQNGKLQTIQFIPPNLGEKLNLPGASFNEGYFMVGDLADTIYFCEGIGHAWAIYQASWFAAVVCFSGGRMKRVAAVLRKKYPGLRLVMVPDREKEALASEIASAVGAYLVELPLHKPKNYDVNDYAQEHGYDELANLLADMKIPTPLSVIFADKLPCNFTPPDELVEGVLIAGDGSILYGDSNSGKTFFVIDLACAVARGIVWMERKTESGLVVYLAAESPASVQRRLQAYQKHHDVRVPNFAIVQSPIDLFDGDADTNKVIQLVHLLERQCGQKARLIVGDTLARLSAGANENAGQDMGLVVRHFDRIRNECSAHFMLIHHSGKNAAAGARGWSGVRAAVDTEIEVTDSAVGRCAEITKQRDLGTKGVCIGFGLEMVTLGLTKWKASATSCVVMSADAPKKQTSKRLSEIAGAIIEYLNVSKNSVKKSELIKHLTDRYSSSAIYREVRKLVEHGQVSDSFGYVRIIVPTSAN